MTPTYFILAGSHVKIGRSQNPEARVSQIATSCPVAPKLLKVSSIDERTAHRIAATITTRENGEWFTDCAELREWIQMLPVGVVLKNESIKTSKNLTPKPFPTKTTGSVYDNFSHFALSKIFAITQLLEITPIKASAIFLDAESKKNPVGQPT